MRQDNHNAFSTFILAAQLFYDRYCCRSEPHAVNLGSISGRMSKQNVIDVLEKIHGNTWYGALPHPIYLSTFQCKPNLISWNAFQVAYNGDIKHDKIV